MKKWLPWILTAVFAAWVLAAMRPPREKTEFNTAGFGRLPVLLNGRVQPLDSVGMNALLSMRGKRTVTWKESQPGGAEKRQSLDPTAWVMEVMMRADDADTRPIFRLQHPDLQGILGGKAEGLEYLSFNDLLKDTNAFGKVWQQAIDLREAEEAKKADPQLRTPYQKDLMHFFDSMILFRRLKNSLVLEGTRDFSDQLTLFSRTAQSASAALNDKENATDEGKADLQLLSRFLKNFQALAGMGYPLVVPPLDPAQNREDWTNIGGSLLRSPQIHPAVNSYAAMATAYAQNKPQDFNRALAEYRSWLEGKGLLTELKKGRSEFFFNKFAPFYKSMAIYVAALVLGCVFWLNFSEPLRRSGFYLLMLALVVHTIGLIFRMWLEGRPPVTNLYSSAIFIGWGAVVLGAILERIYRDGIGIVSASAIGFTTLIIAHHLSLSGDTMEMLQAVLDTNIWLATHVVVITLGYSSMFIAGLLATVYILRGLFTKTLAAPAARSLTRMVYGIVCFSTLFSFVGTILGGIWADQSWGRFWGWDPKENGALLIVIWCAIILHARWGGMIRERGLMAMAVFGNIVTSFSWFGVNMLGVGLHTYGFMDKAFKWLMFFVATQLVLIALAMVPERFWKSFQGSGGGDSGKTPPKNPEPKLAEMAQAPA